MKATVESLSPGDLAGLRAPGDRFGLIFLLTALAGLCVFAPPIGIAAMSMFVTAVALLGAFSAISQAQIAGNGVPIHLVLGSAWIGEIEDLLHRTGRSPASVQVVVVNDPRPNAFATWRPRGRVIVITSGLVSILEGDHQALRVVVGHELGHLIFAHVPPMLLFGGSSLLPLVGGPLGPLFSLVRLWWQRHSERSADRLGLVLSGDLLLTLRVLLALHQGSMPTTVALHSLIGTSTMRPVTPLSSLGESFSTHPYLRSRLRAILSFTLTAQKHRWWNAEIARVWENDLRMLGITPDLAAVFLTDRFPIRPFRHRL